MTTNSNKHNDIKKTFKKQRTADNCKRTVINRMILEYTSTRAGDIKPNDNKN